MYRQLGIKTLMVGPRNLIDFSVRLVLSYFSSKHEYLGVVVILTFCVLFT